jgi:hypothetical protein
MNFLFWCKNSSITLTDTVNLSCVATVCEVTPATQGGPVLPEVTWGMPPKNSKVKSSQANAAKAAKEAAKRHQVTAVRSLLSVFCSAISFT